METLYLGLSVLISLLVSATLVRSETGVSKSSCHFPAIFNFGDSNSDTGGLSAAFGQAPYPNGETYFHTPSGRFSDGRLIVDFIGIFPISLSLIFFPFTHCQVLLTNLEENKRRKLLSFGLCV